MRYARVYNFNTGSTDIWDEATVRLAENHAPSWQVESWHDTRLEAEDTDAANLDRALFQLELDSTITREG
jgi:hypothetical protein